ncbi:MAG: peptidylprolyl isomerase [Candidatus Woesearchaeota archaeon]|jgi:peptidylprolyl isomerase
MAVENGNTVLVHYTGTLDDGTVFDSSEGKEPLKFTVGNHDVIPGFENGVIGMEVGQEKTIDISSDQAYGQKREQLVQKVPKNLFKDFSPEVSQQIGLMSKDGQQMVATVTEVTGELVTLDLNHPLAGKNLHFKVKIEKIE